MTGNVHSTDVDELRSSFLLRPDVVFLNHGSFGACPRPVLEVYQDWQRELERQPVEFLQRRYHTLIRAARERLALFLGAQTEDVIYAPNATSALEIAIDRMHLDPGDEVLSTTHEYGSMKNLWLRLCERSGAHFVQQPIDLPVQSTEQMLESIWRGITPRTRVLFFSHITSPTALTLPAYELIRRARARGLITVVDGAHTPGQVPLNLDHLEADVYVGSCHKWMMGPKGTGFVHVRREAQPLLWGQRQTGEWMGTPHTLDELQWQGTRDIAAYLAIPAAIRFMEEHDWPTVQSRCHKLLSYAREAIREQTGLAPTTPDGPGWFAQLSTIPLPPCDAADLKTKLYKMARIEIPVIGFDGRQFLRVSIQGYNSQSDVEVLIQTLGQLLPLDGERHRDLTP